MHSSLQGYYNQLEKQRQFYVGKVTSAPDNLQQQKPGPEQWSAAQLLYHLWKVEAVVLQSIQENLKSGRTHKPASFNTRYRSFLLNLFLWLPIKFKVPKAVGDTPAQINPQEVVTQWQETRDHWSQFLIDFPNGLLSKEIFKHPRAGLLTLPQTLAFLVEHGNHHRKQMKRLLP